MFTHTRTVTCGAATTVGGDVPFVLDCALSPDGRALAASLSTARVRTLDAATLRATGGAPASLAPPDAPPGSHRLVGLAWAAPTPALLYAACGTTDGWDAAAALAAGRPPAAPRRAAALHALDTRTSAVAATWDLGPAAAAAGELGAMACSASGTLVAVALGSDVCFLDVRKGGGSSGGGGGGGGAPLLDRFGSHSDAVTCLAWHPALPSHALSGGEDGLVNVYDCSVAGEHEALVSTLSVGDSVSHFGVFGPSGALAHVATRAGALSLWNLGSAAKLADFGGAQMRAGLPSCHYLLSAHYAPHSDRLVALAGGEDGTLHVLDVTLAGCALRGSLAPSGGGGGGGARAGHAAALRCAAADAAVRVIYTGGEDGRVCRWEVGGEGGEGGGGGGSMPLRASGVDEAGSFGVRRVLRSDDGGGSDDAS